MSVSIELLQLIIIIMLYIIFFLIARIMIKKLSTLEEIFKRNNQRLSMILSLVSKTFKGTLDSLRALKEVRQTIAIDLNEIPWNPEELTVVIQKEKKRLKSLNPVERKAAVIYLGLIGAADARIAIEAAFIKEKDSSVKIYMSNALTDIHHPDSLPLMIDALKGSKKWYRDKAISNILEYGDLFMPYFENLKNSSIIEYRELIIAFAGENLHNDLKIYLLDFVLKYQKHFDTGYSFYQNLSHSELKGYKLAYYEQDMTKLLDTTCRVLANIYPTDLASEAFWDHPNRTVKVNAFWAASKQKNTEYLDMLLNHFHEDDFEKTLIGCTTKMVENNPRFHYVIEEAFDKELDPKVQNRLATVLANKIEYYILKLNTKAEGITEYILLAILKQGKINEWIGFLNKNNNIDLENRLIQIMNQAFEPDSEQELTLRAYLRADIVEKWGKEPYHFPKTREDQKIDVKLSAVVIMMTILSIILYPMIFAWLNWDLVSSAPFMIYLKEFVITFNYLLAYYSISINVSYLILLLFSYRNLLRQTKQWNLKNLTMLFRNKMLPTISIIAPAYNEEKSIVGSTNSLLNLKYPEYELLIVNDGSTDQTLNTLINYYNLLRVDYYYNDSLKTEPIRGIYRNPSHPKLVVVDKSNGGKADALNAGINVANKEYFCGIDADSLLESEALLKLASLTLDESVETPALGGNIYPLNGCKVENGEITDIRIPDHFLGRLQTIEYIRAFMSGRLGWHEINSLLIISGAFGLFRKDRIISTGGYMTHLGQYKKDTVGEDMELVVRISKLLHDAKTPFKILYSFNANCWTEVPEDLKSLKNQRVRWHRGLIDILYFHKKMLLNPKYGTTGMLGLPYFFVFEAIGPMIEFQGYIMVILAALLDILDPRMALMLFITTILLGIIVSLSSLLIAEHETNYFKTKDLLKLIGLAIIENFGPRQLMSFFRIIGVYKTIFASQSWGHIQRKGM